MKRTSDKIRHGFSLVEAAVVLAVVGLVVAGIWIAAASVTETMNVNKTVSDMALIVNNVQNLISIQQSDALVQQQQYYDLTDTLIASNALPKDWGVGGAWVSPLGYPFQIKNFDFPPHSFAIMFQGIPASICTKIVFKIAAIGARTGTSGNMSQHSPTVMLIQINSSSQYNYDAFPVSLANAETACNQTSNVSFFYGYSRVN